ncbi:MAG: RsbRD N-terminal domain-containing protein [Acidobacteria bacterium]|nr:RsbRD N-terminal domain-containing protein [Acidobacteriota bacterium]
MQQKEAIGEQWFRRVLRTHPYQTAEFLGEVEDPLRNPVGHTLKQSLGILLDELLLGMESSRVTAALDAIVRVQAVEDLMPSRALEFLFQLKYILRVLAPEAVSDLLYSRIDEPALRAFDLYAKYREKNTCDARANEGRHRVYALERRLLPRDQAAWQRQGAV